jgi:hypothetical protein
MGETVKEAVKKFNREHPKGFFGKLMKNTRENAEERSRERAETQTLEKEAYTKAYQRARVARASREGAAAGGRRWTDMFSDIRISSPTPSRNYTSRPSHKKKTKKKRRRTSRRRSSGGMFDVGGGGFDLTDNWGFMK